MQMLCTNSVLRALSLLYNYTYIYSYKPLHESVYGVHGNALLSELLKL